ncbi:hypothetical protein FRC03_008027 [Tulasnella sp. 419]|nr:hypothetical protein FRC03_008027 [Tulasnella sp. 419]
MVKSNSMDQSLSVPFEKKLCKCHKPPLEGNYSLSPPPDVAVHRNDSKEAIIRIWTSIHTTRNSPLGILFFLPLSLLTMEVFGTVASAIALAQQLKFTFDRASLNKSDGFALSLEIVDLLLRIEKISRQNLSRLNIPQLQGDLDSFTIGLQQILTRRQYLIKEPDNHWWSKLAISIKELCYANHIYGEMNEMKSQLKCCVQGLQISCALRTECVATETNLTVSKIRDEQRLIVDKLQDLSICSLETLGRIDSSIRTLIDDATQDDTKAKVLVGVRKMSLSRASRSLREAKKAIDMDESLDDQETKYLKLKIKALKDVLPSLLTQEPELDNIVDSDFVLVERFQVGGWITSYHEVDGLTQQKEDSVQETLRILRLLRSKETTYSNAAEGLRVLSSALSEIGMWEEAAGICSCEVDLRRELAKNSQRESLANLAGALLNQSVYKHQVGELEESFKLAQDSLQLRNQLADQSPDFYPDVAFSLTRLSSCADELGKNQEALSAAEAAVQIYRQLGTVNPSVRARDLAYSLTQYSYCLRNVGRHGDAFQITMEALVIRQRLAKVQPTTMLPDLAQSLTQLSANLIHLGRYDDAIEITNEALAVRRRLVRAREDAFLPGLAYSLVQQSLCLVRLERPEEALLADNEALTIYRELAGSRPGAYLPSLGQCLCQLSSILGCLGKHEKAKEAIDEAIGVYRELAKTRADTMLPKLVRSLKHRTTCLLELGHYEDALNADEEILGICRKLSSSQSILSLYQLADSSNSVAWRLHQLNRDDEGVSLAEDAVSIFRNLSHDYPEMLEQWVGIKRLSRQVKKGYKYAVL